MTTLPLRDLTDLSAVSIAPTHLAWLAGVIDARAHIETHDRHGHLQPRVRITTRETRLLDRLAQVSGNRVVKDDRGYRRRPCSAHCDHPHSEMIRQSSQWTVDSGRATIVLWNVLPYMEIQRFEARQAMETGLCSFPPARGDVARQMADLGWKIPEANQ